MDLQRARQVINADETIRVTHNGSPVWIESLDPVSGKARVKPLDGRGGIREVPVAELAEG